MSSLAYNELENGYSVSTIEMFVYGVFAADPGGYNERLSRVFADEDDAKEFARVANDDPDTWREFTMRPIQVH